MVYYRAACSSLVVVAARAAPSAEVNSAEPPRPSLPPRGGVRRRQLANFVGPANRLPLYQDAEGQSGYHSRCSATNPRDFEQPWPASDT